uniref:Uncharacterized protein n=1 Tax=Anguilla anguilla TaxID=7936 RepID=A0A0E9SZK2_ANGAN
MDQTCYSTHSQNINHHRQVTSTV